MSQGFERAVPVHWNDCDPARIVFHAHYVRWMDEGFTEFLRARGIDFARMQDADPQFRGSPLVDVAMSFRSPARFGDLLTHEIDPPVFGEGRSFRVTHRFRVGGRLVAEGHQVRVWCVADGDRLRAVAVPTPIVERLAA